MRTLDSTPDRLAAAVPRALASPRAVLRAGVGELIEAVHAGELPLHQAVTIAVFSPADQRAIVAAVAGMTATRRARLLRRLMARAEARS